MTDALYRLVYLSRNDISGDSTVLQHEIGQILEQSRQNNPRAGVTGALMFNAGCFAQVLEGPHDAIQDTFERIQCDERHSQVTVLAFEATERRGFSHWAMAYVGGNADNAEYFAALEQNAAVDFTALDGDNVYQLLQSHLAEAESA